MIICSVSCSYFICSWIELYNFIKSIVSFSLTTYIISFDLVSNFFLNSIYLSKIILYSSNFFFSYLDRFLLVLKLLLSAFKCSLVPGSLSFNIKISSPFVFFLSFSVILFSFLVLLLLLYMLILSVNFVFFLQQFPIFYFLLLKRELIF